MDTPTESPGGSLDTPRQPRFRAIDFHTHVRTAERRESSDSLRDAESLFGATDRSTDPVAFFASRRMQAVIFDVDAETTDGRRMSNDEVAALAERSGGHLIPFASVDPWKGRAAIRELERCHDLGMRGLKLQPITQAFALNDPRFRLLWDACQSLGLPVLVHGGTTGIGAGTPGGRGLRLEFGRPIPAVDDVAAAYPGLTIVVAHFAWPWHLELMAVARHKGNVYVDLSGWAPRYIPPEVIRYCDKVMPEKFVYGSDFPLLDPDRWHREFDALGLKDHVRRMVLYENAVRILGLETADYGPG